jgi:hypothetical protein
MPVNHPDYPTALLQTIREPMLVLDDTLRVMMSNLAFRRTFGDPRLAHMERVLERAIPAGRTLSVEEVADVIAFLATPRARFFNGATFFFFTSAGFFFVSSSGFSSGFSSALRGDASLESEGRLAIFRIFFLAACFALRLGRFFSDTLLSSEYS